MSGTTMSLEQLWTNVKKIWEKGRKYSLKEMIKDNNEEKRVVFEKDGEEVLAVALAGKLRVAFLREIKTVLEESDYKMCTLASVGRATWYAEEEAEEVEKEIEIISEDHPLFYILDHWLVPQHEVLQKEKAEEVIERYTNDNEMELPKITAKDPVARILRAKPGDIIKVTRKTPDRETLIEKYGEKTGKDAYSRLQDAVPAGKEVFYRLVVEREREELF